MGRRGKLCNRNCLLYGEQSGFAAMESPYPAIRVDLGRNKLPGFDLPARSRRTLHNRQQEPECGGGRAASGTGGRLRGVGSAVREKTALRGVKQRGDVRPGAGGPTGPRQECALCHLRFTAAFSHDPKTLSSSFETYYQFCFHDGFVWEDERQIGRGGGENELRPKLGFMSGQRERNFYKMQSTSEGRKSEHSPLQMLF